MCTKVVVVLVALVAALASAAPDGYQQKYKAKPYQYDYSVHDDYHGTHFGQSEKSNGDGVYGSYTVALPDGRKQHVHYEADPYKGYVAKVSYEGQAKHPKTYGAPVTFFNKGHGGGYH